MSETGGTQLTSHTATQPIINIRDEENAHNISWEVTGDDPLPAPLSEIQKEEDPKEEITIEDVQTPEDDDENEKEKISQDSQDDNLEKKKTLRAPKDKRFADFTRKIKQRDTLINEYSAENVYLKKQLAIKDEEKVKDEAKYISSEITNIEKAHAEALAEGDYETATKAASLLAQYSARKETLTQQRNHLEAARQNVNPQPQFQESETSPQSEEFEINGTEWKKNNPWADDKSVNYDHEMLQEAENHVMWLMKQYKRQGRGDEIGSPDFFNEITHHIDEVYGFSSSPAKPTNKLVMKGNTAPGVAPVSRGATVSNTTKSRQEVNLTPEQIAFAHSMSGKVSFNGVRVTDKAKLEAIYKANLIQQSKRG